jgi:hypothetical protein
MAAPTDDRPPELLVRIDPWVFCWAKGAARILMVRFEVNGPPVEGTVMTGVLDAELVIPDDLSWEDSQGFQAHCREVLAGMADAATPPVNENNGGYAGSD